ncbi:hypothetical protein [Paraburkholderia acidiphila]|uniref:Uncharacterized protein n=1 Tax=Paraburkholderia acidiphila TaxID=2571747 RepID=A0A7Z2G8P8_9BURK|nr:hypothetical protein [Paraburkholderia acidiphila]QGZ57176.1 hypothetical protein FAZ97_19815 [Paraburkholderia acidiphila]
MSVRSKFALPTIAWIDLQDRERLLELAEVREVAPERIAGRLLSKALREYTPGSLPEPAVKAQKSDAVGSAGRAKKAR